MSIQSLLHESVPYLANYGLIIAYAGAILEGETVILLVGVLCHQGFLDVDEIVVATALGALTGDQMWFHLGSRYGNGVLARFPRLQRNANRVRPWLEQKSNWVAMACRFIYGTRVIAPLMLGMEKYPSLRFFLINIVTASLWAVIFVGAGYLLGTSVEQMFGRLEHVEILLLSIILFMLGYRWYQRRKPQV